MVQAVLTDIEGTTSSLSFVKEVLFPYARERIAEFVYAQKQKPTVQKLLEDARAEAGAELDDQGLIAQFIAWIDADKKITVLKELQGMIWEDGYRRGDFTGHIYRDAVHQLRHWQQRGLHLYVYSSGSVHAQQLLFAHTDYGDLTPLFSGYFDTNVGPKQEAKSYRAIAESIGIAPGEIVFLSDVVEELDAARKAGMQTFHLVRSGALTADSAHCQVRNFDAINIF